MATAAVDSERLLSLGVSGLLPPLWAAAFLRSGPAVSCGRLLSKQGGSLIYSGVGGAFMVLEAPEKVSDKVTRTVTNLEHFLLTSINDTVRYSFSFL